MARPFHQYTCRSPNNKSISLESIGSVEPLSFEMFFLYIVRTWSKKSSSMNINNPFSFWNIFVLFMSVECKSFSESMLCGTPEDYLVELFVNSCYIMNITYLIIKIASLYDFVWGYL